jgi:hypothetical protein
LASIEARVHPRSGFLPAIALVALGIFPGPQLMLLRDPAMAGDPTVLTLPGELAYRAGATLLFIVPVVLLATMGGAWLDQWTERTTRALAGVPAVVVVGLAVVFAILASVWVSAYAFSHRPVNADEFAQLWHAKTLLTGRLALPLDPNPEFFALDNVVDEGRWYSQFPIGGPMVLALGLAVGVPWLVNPLLAGVMVINVYRFAVLAYDGATARWAAVLTALSPMVLIMSGSYMNHTAVACLATLALASSAAWARAEGAVRVRHAAIVGVALGSAITIRPVDGAIAALVIGAFMLATALRTKRPNVLPSLVAGAVAGAIPIALLLVANAHTTGHPFRFGYEVLWGANHSLGFHPDPMGNPHTLKRGIELAQSYLVLLNWVLQDWPLPALAFPVLTLLLTRRMSAWDAVLVSWIFVQLATYAAYWHNGTFGGPRYLFTVVPAFIVLAARAPLIVARAVPAARRVVWSVVAVSIAAAWLIYTPPYGAVGNVTTLRPLRRGMKLDYEPALASIRGQRAVIFASELVTQRLSRRLWALGLSRPDAAGIQASADGCALLDAVIAEEARDDTPAARLARLSQARPYVRGRVQIVAADAAFRVSDSTSVTPTCAAELMADRGRAVAVSFGPLMLRNQLDDDGRLTGPIVFAADLSERNELLRARFGDRAWYRMEMPPGAAVPVLVPYR